MRMGQESVQELFGRVAVELAGEVAIERAGSELKYGELEEESNKLASFLVETGTDRGSIVGLMAEDPIAVITGILGILKAGAVFAPLDCRFPENRLKVMVEQIRPTSFVVESRFLRKLGAVSNGSNAGVICVDEPDEVRSGTGGLKLLEGYGRYRGGDCRQTDPEGACSIYFTSGSTGRPKAILGRLKGIDHFVRWEIEALGVGRGTRVSQLASPSFDGFLKDAFVPLCGGGVVCAPQSRDVILEPRKLIEWVEAAGIEILHCIPSVFRSMINEGLKEEEFQALRYVVMAGEPLLPADVRRWMEVYGERIKLVNLYGTTAQTTHN